MFKMPFHIVCGQNTSMELDYEGFLVMDYIDTCGISDIQSHNVCSKWCFIIPIHYEI